MRYARGFMPIRPEFRALYGAQHRAYRAKLIDVFGPRCMRCGRECQHYLNLCHLTHDPKAAETVALYCASCHASHDSRHALAVRRRTWAKRAGQLWLWTEVEFAAVPSWAIPRRVLTELQGRLF
jgi:hypothetical protein